MRRTRLALVIVACLAATACGTTQTSESTTASSSAHATAAPPGQHAANPQANPQADGRLDRETPADARQRDGDRIAGKPAPRAEKKQDEKDIGATEEIRANRPVVPAPMVVMNEPAPAAAMIAEPPPPPSPMMMKSVGGAISPNSMQFAGSSIRRISPQAPGWNPAQAVSAGEQYAKHDDNPVQRTAENPVSTFSIDVDTGSYSNVRRMLAAGQRPPADAVRAEEMINYFDYAYPAPSSRAVPFRVTTEMAPAPWNAKHTLLQIGIKGYDVAHAQIPPSNLVFLIDTSGSMDEPNKLPLLKQAFAQLVPNLRAQDRVSIVVYAGSAGLVLPPTPGDHHAQILAALGKLEAGGSTNGGAGIGLAYAQARSSFIKGGANRIILATDGDFNVGVSDVGSLKEMVARERDSGIALTTLGFGVDNYNDTMAEQLADIGDGNHAYIDNINEARKVFVDEMSSTLLTIAKDVKIQMEFNPAVVTEYRLIGYEDRALRREDFNNDKVDAGEIGAGHNVTAIYELSLAGSGGDSVDPLRYAPPRIGSGIQGEIGLLRLRYKQPDATTSKLIETPLRLGDVAATASPRLRFAAAVAAYADKLRGGTHLNGYSWDAIDALARATGGVDRYGYRAEFERLVGKARALDVGAMPVAVTR
ncbi:MAG TPA: VWA domain-containing protein [Xanthomonadaceae bacterium]|jgi:Ca-activated chloride channel family protein